MQTRLSSNVWALSARQQDVQIHHVRTGRSGFHKIAERFKERVRVVVRQVIGRRETQFCGARNRPAIGDCSGCVLGQVVGTAAADAVSAQTTLRTATPDGRAALDQ